MAGGTPTALWSARFQQLRQCQRWRRAPGPALAWWLRVQLAGWARLTGRQRLMMTRALLGVPWRPPREN